MSGHSSQQFSLQPLLASSLASLSPLPCLLLALAVLFSRSHLMLHQGSRETIPVGSVTVVEPARSDAASLQGWRLLPQRFRLWNLQVLLLPTHLSQRRTQFQYFPVFILLPMHLWQICPSCCRQTLDQIVITCAKELNETND